MSHRRIIAIVAGALLVGTLSGCIPGMNFDVAGAARRELVEGDCLESIIGDVMYHYPERVPCTEPHASEVIAAIDLPADYRDAAFDDVMDSSGAIREDLLYYGLGQCRPAIAEITGLADAVEQIDALAGSGSVTWPLFEAVVMIYATPQATWESDARLICAVEWRTPGAETVQVSSPTDEPLIATLVRGGLPGRFRSCPVLEGGAIAGVVDCDASAHAQEWLFRIDVGKTLGDEFVAAVDPEAVTDEQRAALDGICAASAPAVFGGGAHNGRRDHRLGLLLPDLGGQPVRRGAPLGDLRRTSGGPGNAPRWPRLGSWGPAC